MSDPAQAIASLPVSAARLLACEILLADPEALADDVLEGCLYLLRERLRAAGTTNASPADSSWL